MARTQFWCCGPDGLVPTKRSALWREIHFGRSAYILRKIFLVKSFYRIEPTIRYTLAMFFRKFPRFQGIVVQVHQLYAPRCGKTHILAWRRCLPHVDVLKGGFFHSSSCHACLGQASVSLGAPRMPTNLLHHGSQNRIQKTSRNMAARKEPRLYCVYILRGPPLRGPESTTASTAKSDVALAHFLPGFSMSNNPAIVGTCSSIFMFVLERD